jgi:3-oxoacyl-[acyl-carrier protein] reductase
MDLGLNGKVVLVTGATSGIGRAIATGFAAEGATVVAHGHTGFTTLPSWCDPLGISTVAGDLRDPEEVERVFDHAVAAHGRIDIVAANAGKWPEPDLRIDQTPVEALRQALDDNLWTAMLTARAFFRALGQTGPSDGGAALVFTGSTAGRFGERGHVAYATAKSALHGLVATLKNEIVALDPKGRVNGVQPGWTMTPAVAHHVTDALVQRISRTMALRQVATAEDIARAAIYLTAPATSRHVSGEWITVAGGMEGRIVHD